MRSSVAPRPQPSSTDGSRANKHMASLATVAAARSPGEAPQKKKQQAHKCEGGEVLVSNAKPALPQMGLTLAVTPSSGQNRKWVQ